MPGSDNNHFLSYLSPVREAYTTSLPRSRSSSFKKSSQRRSHKPHRAQDGVGSEPRPRSYSLPSSRSPGTSATLQRHGQLGVDGEGAWWEGMDRYSLRLCRVRSVKVTPRGGVSNDDPTLMRSSLMVTSLTSLMSSGSLLTSSSSNNTTTSTTSGHPHFLSPHRPRTLSLNSRASSSGWTTTTTNGGSRTSICAPPSFFRVALLGAPGVGKSALVRQFLSSEYRGTFDINTPEYEDKETAVSVFFDGEESVVDFIDDPKESNWESMRADAFLVVFSLSEESSYRWAQHALWSLRSVLGLDRTILLVGNKVDLVRQRKVSFTEARATSLQFECQLYAETSAAFNHNVEEVILSLLTHTRTQLITHTLPQPLTSPTLSGGEKGVCCTSIAGKRVLGFFRKLFVSVRHDRSKKAPAIVGSSWGNTVGGSRSYV